MTDIAHGNHTGAGADDVVVSDYTVLLVFTDRSADRFWLARHRDRGWELPGGRVEPGEDLQTAAEREWMEEVGLPLAHLQPLALHERPGGDRGHVFLGYTDGPDPPDKLPDPKIEEVRAVHRIAEVSPLAFPDDPYAQAAELAERVVARWHDVVDVDLVSRLVPPAVPSPTRGQHRVLPHPLVRFPSP